MEELLLNHTCEISNLMIIFPLPDKVANTHLSLSLLKWRTQAPACNSPETKSKTQSVLELPLEAVAGHIRT